MRPQFGEQCVIRFGSQKQARKRLRVSHLEISGIIFAQQPDVTRNARRYYRRSRDNRFRNDIRPALQAGGMDSQLAAPQDLSNAPLRLFANPFVTRVDPHLAARAFGHLFVHRSAHVDDSDAR